LKRFFQSYLICALLLIVAACATPVSKFRDESVVALQKVRASGAEALFPLEAEDFYNTLKKGDSELVKGEIEEADAYYSLAIGKAKILRALHKEELKRRKEAAARELELKLKAEAELELQKQREREQAEELEREAERLKRLEAEKTVARRKAERSRQEREVQLVPRHIVKRGETLPQIAALAEVYGDASLWPLIYKANRDQIGNPSVLWPGQVLRIPRNSDKNEINDARRFSSERPLR
jgi:nucleoid-associated protein YgaU